MTIKPFVPTKPRRPRTEAQDAARGVETQTARIQRQRAEIEKDQS